MSQYMNNNIKTRLYCLRNRGRCIQIFKSQFSECFHRPDDCEYHGHDLDHKEHEIFTGI
jgi:hypothetical protein